jgi:Cys-rich protein (TIGR01571 family)
MAQNTATATATGTATWRNQIFGCCDTPMLCINTMFCAPCVLAQIRGKLGTYMGLKSFKNFLYALIMLYVLMCVLQIVKFIVVEILLGEYVKAYTDGDFATATNKLNESVAIQNVLNIPVLIIWIIFFVIVLKTRFEVREHKQFQPDGCNDFLCAFCCMSCTVVQTAREVEVTEDCCNMKEPEGAMTGLDKV